MDIGRVLKDSWVIFAKDWVALIVAALITIILSVVTLGILAVPLSAGLYRMILRRIREGRQAEVGDVFGCFDRFGAYFLAYLLFLGIGLVYVAVVGLPLVLLVINNSGARALGWVLFLLALFAAVVVGVYLQTVWVYWTILMVDRRRAVVEALKESRAIVTRSGFWMTLLVFIIVSLIAYAVSGALSAVTFGIGGFLAFLVLPWEFAAYTAMYFQAGGESGLLPSAFPGPSSAWQGGGAVAFGGPGASYQAAGYPPGYAPPAGPPPGYAPPAGPPPGYGPPSQPPWMTVPTTPPPWAQGPAGDQSAPSQTRPVPPAAAPAPQQPPASDVSPPVPESPRTPEALPAVPPDAAPPASGATDSTVAGSPAPGEPPDVSPPAPPTPPTPPV
jgi:hypothetical protein